MAGTVEASLVERLVAAVGSSGPLDPFCDSLAELIGADAVWVLVCNRGGGMSVGGRAGELGVGWSEEAAINHAISEFGGRIGGEAGDDRPERDPVEWAALQVGGVLVGAQAVRWGDEPGGSQREALAATSALLARCIERRGVIAGFRRADELKSEFVRTVSHELRTPLTTVIGYADLLVEEAFGPIEAEQRKILRRVGDRARGLLEVISATLDLPGVAGGRVALETRQVSMVDVLRELEADAREWRLRHDLEYRWFIPEELPVLVTDAGKVRVILKNLIANAVKFTDRGSITVRAYPRDDGVEISVEDTGIGIEADAVHYVFDAFKQASSASPATSSGVGLGLYIVRRLVNLLDGRLRVESEFGVGTKFHVWLPCGAENVV